MERNIFQVKKESHIDEILEAHEMTLIVLMLAKKRCDACKMMKPKFIKLSKENKDCFFIYADIEDIKDYKKYSVTHVPKFIFYVGTSPIGDLTGGHEESLINMFNEYKKKIDDAKYKMQQKEIELIKQKKLQDETKRKTEPDHNGFKEMLIKKKIAILNKLSELVNNGFVLTKSYNIESDYGEMVCEYEYQLSENNSERNKEQTDSQSEELLKKKQQYKEIQELNKARYIQQMQQLQKIKQIEQLQQAKERVENQASIIV